MTPITAIADGEAIALAIGAIAGGAGSLIYIRRSIAPTSRYSPQVGRAVRRGEEVADVADAASAIELAGARGTSARVSRRVAFIYVLIAAVGLVLSLLTGDWLVIGLAGLITALALGALLLELAIAHRAKAAAGANERLLAVHGPSRSEDVSQRR